MLSFAYPRPSDSEDGPVSQEYIRDVRQFFSSFDPVNASELELGKFEIYMFHLHRGFLTKEQVGVTDAKLAILNATLSVWRDKRMMIDNAYAMYRLLCLENDKFFSFLRRATIRKKAEALKAYMKEKGLTYKECRIDEAFLDEMIK